MQVTIQYRETRKPKAWVTAFRATVLYSDAKVILVRGAGAESLFEPTGEMLIFRSNRKHPAGAKLPLRIGRVRIHPSSLARLYPQKAARN